MKVKTRKCAEALSKAAPGINAIIIGIAMTGLTAIAQADPLSDYDEGMTATLILKECKVDPSVLSHLDSHAEPRFRAIGDAAWRELLAPLDAQDSDHHEENGHKANAELTKRTVADLARVRESISVKSCAALVPHALEVLERILQ